MAISLGSLFVELKANTGQFVDGMTKASVNAKAFGRDVQSSLSGLGELFAPLGEAGEKLAGVFNVLGSSARGAFAEIGKSGALEGGLLALTGGTAALLGGMIALAQKSAEAGNKIYEASEKTGIGAEQMSGLAAASKETGGDLDSLVKALARFGANLQEAIVKPGGESGKMLAQLMGGMKQLAAEGAKPMGDRVYDVTKRIMELSNVGERNLMLSKMFGKGWQDNIAVLKILVDEGFGPLIEQSKALGGFFTDESARNAHEFKITMDSMTAELEGLGLAIGQQVMPSVRYWIEGIHELLPYIDAWAHAVLGLKDGAEGLGEILSAPWKTADIKQRFKDASEEFAKERALIDGADEAQNQWLAHVKALAGGSKGDKPDPPLGEIKAHADALANLISRETEQLALLNTNGNKVQQLKIEYAHTVDEIHKLVAAGGSFKEGLAAQGLALDIYHKKLMDIAGVFPQVGANRWAQLIKLPAFAIPTTLPFQLTPPKVPSFESSTPAGIAASTREMDKTRQAEKAMRLEADLSNTSLMKLSTAFQGLTNAQIVASAAGQRMIEQLSKLDKFGGFGQQFKEMTDSLITEGGNFGGNMLKVVGHSIDQIEDKFAEMVVKGRANFRELGQTIEQEMVKATLQKGVSMLLGGLTGGKLGGSKPDGTAGNPLHVVMAAGGRAAGSLGGAVGSLAGSAKGLFSGIFSSIFGGFLADGGDVTPGKAYIVGEHRPELFVPRMAGHVAPSTASQQMRPLVFSPVYNITTPDADSFRRSQSQVAADAYRSMALAHARSNK